MVTWQENAEQHTGKPFMVMEIDLNEGPARYAAQDTEIDGVFYEGRVMQFGTVHRAISDSDFRFEISDITSRLSNADGYFSGLDYKKFLNREVIYRSGWKGSLLSEFKTVFKGVTAGYRFAGTAFEMAVKSSLYIWLEKDYGHVINAADWPHAASGVAGTKMPILYGNLTGHI